jgi:D-glycero-alpha-D-manno-heptose-7-phosphate kinase
MEVEASPGHVIRATAPIRICDNGGWTDTWFAGHGAVFNIGVTPCAEVEVATFPAQTRADRIVLDVVNYHDHYGFAPGDLPGRHPLLEAIVDEVGLPDSVSVEISLRSGVPPGSSTGTSAAVAVALMGAMDALTPGSLSPYEVAAGAHRIEVDVLGAESGVQDQLCSAFGGVNYIEILRYPRARVTQLEIPADTLAELEARLVLVYLGRAHVSSETHRQVIAAVRARTTGSEAVLDELRSAAVAARDAVLTGDFRALGKSFRRNTDAQSSLHPDLVGPEARKAIEVGAANGVLGWKVNGAGGAGGSITFLCQTVPESRQNLERALQFADPEYRVIPTSLARSGLQISELPTQTRSPSPILRDPLASGRNDSPLDRRDRGVK